MRFYFTPRPGFDSWVGKISWRRKWQPTLVFLSGKSHGWRSLVGYSPWGPKDHTYWDGIIKESENNKCYSGCGKIRTYIYSWWECKMVPWIWKTTWQCLEILKMSFLWPGNLQLGTHSRKMKTYVHMSTCMWMVIGEQFLITKR